MRACRLFLIGILVIGCVTGRRQSDSVDDADLYDYASSTEENDDTRLTSHHHQDHPHHNQLWVAIQPKLRAIVDSYEMACTNAGVNFNRAKMDEELKVCFHQSIEVLLRRTSELTPADQLQLYAAVEAMKGERNLDSGQIRTVKQHIVEPTCHFTSTILDCFKPHYRHVVEQCTYEVEGKAVEYSELLVAAACRNNGSRIVEFLANGGVECFSVYAEQGRACLEQNSTLLTATNSKPKTIMELCERIGTVHGCLFHSVDQCSKKAPGKPLKIIFAELKDWTSNQCLRSSAPLANLFLSKTLFSAQTLLIFLIPILNVIYMQGNLK